MDGVHQILMSNDAEREGRGASLWATSASPTAAPSRGCSGTDCRDSHAYDQNFFPWHVLALNGMSSAPPRLSLFSAPSRHADKHRRAVHGIGRPKRSRAGSRTSIGSSEAGGGGGGGVTSGPLSTAAVPSGGGGGGGGGRVSAVSHPPSQSPTVTAAEEGAASEVAAGGSGPPFPSPPYYPSPPPAVAPGTPLCAVCGAIFLTAAQLAAHAAGRHFRR